MTEPKSIQISRDTQDLYNKATTVQARYEFYNAYFEEVTPKGLTVVPIADIASGVRKEIRLLSLYSSTTLFSGLVHRPSDKEAEEIAADEAYTRAGEEQDRGTFRFFTAAETISFFEGALREGHVSDGNWRLEKMFHPVNEAQEVHDYLEERLMAFSVLRDDMI